MSNATERFLYEIRPIKPIKDLIPGKGINTPCSMHLTKEEALHCMKYGSVYRNFSDSGMNPIRTTGKNIDRLHNPKFISEDEWEKMKNKDTVQEVTVEEIETTVEESDKEVDETSQEEVMEDAITVEDVPVEEPVPTVEEQPEEKEDFLPIEEEESSVTSSEEQKKDRVIDNHHSNKINYSSKNNKSNNKNHHR